MSTKCQTPFRKDNKLEPLSREGKNSVKVYCRVKPLMNDTDIACLRVVSPTTVQLFSPDALTNRDGMYKEMQYTFNEVFCDGDSQKKVFDVVSLPLVENLIQGKNSLLFTYGVTGSGKTFTMTGDHENGGIMPRCIDTVFNSIAGYQARKCVFKPDKMNGFDVQSESEAKIERVNSLKLFCTPRTPFKTPSKRKDASSKSIRIPDPAKVDGIEEDNVYAIFVTYVEIYNNYVYDLLEEIPDERMCKGLQNRLVRCDSKNNMYVHGITEVEVASPQEAFDVFNKGQKRKRLAHTNLNAESSRSHVVFSIRLVQAPLDASGENALCDKKAVTVSQLSLADLAGSERTNRTQNKGKRLREAGNINNSLMTLRTCLEILRGNQMSGTNKIVPYRDAKITHLFKNFFEGEGQVNVMVCVNPRPDDYDENLHVLKFAEMTREILTKPAVPEKPIVGLIPGRRRYNELLKEVSLQSGVKSTGDVSGEGDIGPLTCVYDFSLVPPFPPMDQVKEFDEKLIQDFVSVMKARTARRVELARLLHKKQEDFRVRISDVQNENILSAAENSSMKISLQQERRRAGLLENQIASFQARVLDLQNTIEDRENSAKALAQEVRQLQLELNQKKYDEEKLKLECTNVIAEEKEKLIREFEQKLKRKEEELQSEMYRDQKLRKMQEVLNEKYGTTGSATVLTPTYPSTSNMCCAPSRGGCEMYLPSVGVLNGVKNTQSPRSRPASNPVTPLHHARRSSCNDLWLHHRSAMPTELGTVLQPKMKKRKSVNNLTEVADIANPKVSKYCLMTQEPDCGGELETRLYKADVIPTTSGGAHIVFNDLESMKQMSPLSLARKRNVADQVADTPERCAVSIEGHSKRMRK